MRRAAGRRVVLEGVLGAAAMLCVGAARGARAATAGAHFPFGPVTPALRLPSWPLLTHANERVDSNALFEGRVTALQLMFTGCSATCPIQGAIFAAAQRHLGDGAGDARLLSLSIDPLADNPAALRGWLKRFDAGPGWIAAAPRLDDLDQIRILLRGDNSGGNGTEPRPTDAHSAQVYLIDRHGRLVHRSTDFPPVEQVVENLRRLQADAT